MANSVAIVIYQKRYNDGVGYKVENIIDLNDYEPTYVYVSDKFDPCEVFNNGNLKLPLKYSLSVGDLIVAMRNGKIIDAYVIDYIGFKKAKNLINKSKN